MKMAVVDAGRLLVLTAGFHDHSLNVVDARSGVIATTLDVVKAWDGIAFDPTNGTIYLSGGGRAIPSFTAKLSKLASRPAMADSIDTPILRVRYAGGKLTPEAGIRIEGLNDKDRYISGITLGPDGSRYTR